VLIATTPAATMRAEVSLTGFGNGKRFVMRLSILLYPTNLVRYYLSFRDRGALRLYL